MSEKPNCEPQARPPLLSVETPNSETFQMGSGKGEIPPWDVSSGFASLFHTNTQIPFSPYGTEARGETMVGVNVLTRPPTFRKGEEVMEQSQDLGCRECV